MRAAVFLLAVISAIVLVWSGYGVATMHSDATGMGMAWGFWVVGAAFTACCMIPAVILAACDRLPRLALILALVPGLVLLLLLADGLI